MMNIMDIVIYTDFKLLKCAGITQQSQKKKYKDISDIRFSTS